MAPNQHSESTAIVVVRPSPLALSGPTALAVNATSPREQSTHPNESQGSLFVGALVGVVAMVVPALAFFWALSQPHESAAYEVAHALEEVLHRMHLAELARELFRHGRP
jgi:hypothetical protein